MNISDFPNYQTWIDATARQSNGLVLCALIALAAFTWLMMARQTWPRLLPVLRAGLIALYFFSLLLVLLGGFHRV